MTKHDWQWNPDDGYKKKPEPAEPADEPLMPEWLPLTLLSAALYVHIIAAAALFYFDLWQFGVAVSIISLLLLTGLGAGAELKK